MTRDTFSLIISLLGTIAGIFSIVVSYLTIGVKSDKRKKQLHWIVSIVFFLQHWQMYFLYSRMILEMNMIV